MNSAHVSVSAAATAYLTTLLTGFHGLDADHAAAAAGLTIMAGAGIWALARWLVGLWKPANPLPLRPE